MITKIMITNKRLIAMYIVFFGFGCYVGAEKARMRDLAYRAGYLVGYSHAQEGYLINVGFTYHPERKEDKFDYVGYGNEVIFGPEKFKQEVIRAIKDAGFERNTK